MNSNLTNTYRGKTYERLQVGQAGEHVLQVQFSRPEKLNAWDPLMWAEVRELFADIADDETCRVVVVTAAGRMFTAGLDLSAGPLFPGGTDAARSALIIRRTGKEWQRALSNVQECGKAVVVCLHKACIGVGVEFASACDVRWCTTDTFFAMPEVDIALAADVGGLQRFPKIVGNDSLVRELALTGRRFVAEEARAMGFVSRVCPDQGSMYEQALALAAVIASKSPVATLGAKTLLNYSRDHTVEEALDYALTWNQAMLQTKDMQKAAMAQLKSKGKQPALFDALPAAPAPLGPAKL